MAEPSLDELRARIDGLDDRVLALLEERAGVVRDVARAKQSVGQPVWDPERERALLDRLVARASGHFPADAVRAVYREIMSACLALQEPHAVAFLGPEGTFSHMAARELFGLAVRYVECTAIDGVFDAVRRGAAMYGVVPIENSTEGAVNSTTDALLDGQVRIRRERVLPIAHSLVSSVGALTEIERVYSHPQALAQCRGWLARNLATAQLVQTPSTAQAVREAAADFRGAAIASRLAAELHGVPVLYETVSDRADNATRFVVIGLEDSRPTGRDKTTIAFALPDESERGALRRALELFDDNGLNLARIESRPSRTRAWRYTFLVDIEGHREDPAVAAALSALAGHASALDVLGSYPRESS